MPMRKCVRVVLACLALLVGILPLAAQTDAPTPPQTRSDTLQVFLQRGVDGTTRDRLQFVDSLTGISTPLDVEGVDYTIVGDAVLYRDSASGRVMLAEPDATEPREHPFIQPTAITRRLDWVVSPDGKKIGWTTTESTPTNALVTTTHVANTDGSDNHEVLADGPRDGIRVLPLSFGRDNTVLYMDYQPDTIGDVTPFRQYAGVFALTLTDSQQRMLPGEPGCFCGAGVGGDLFVRLKLASDLEGFDVVAHNLSASVGETITAMSIANYTQAGDVLVAPDGSLAVYALAQVRDFGSPSQFIRTVFVLVDLVDGTQTALTEPFTLFLQPIAWTEDNTALLFTSPLENGTWKVNIEDGRLSKIASAAYLGTLQR
jgi:hypothetical protein